MNNPSDPTEKALALWGMQKAQCRFVAGRENRVYRVTHGAATYALRFKRPGYHSVEELASELDWLVEMDRAGLNVPLPQVSQKGGLLESVDGRYVDLVSWLDGKPIGSSRAPLEIENPVDIFEALGAEMARFHLACDAWERPATFTRCVWDMDGLLGDTPRWGRFWDNPTLDVATKSLLQEFRSQARRDLNALTLDTGLIHADIVRENVLLDGDRLSLIDFDDGGFGFRLFDIATTLLKNRDEPQYPALKAALMRGYLDLRNLDMDALDLFIALRATTYVGWIVPRMKEPGAIERNVRFIKDARKLCEAYLTQSKVSEGEHP